MIEYISATILDQQINYQLNLLLTFSLNKFIIRIISLKHFLKLNIDFL